MPFEKEQEEAKVFGLIIQTKVSAGLKENVLPVEKTTVRTQAPMINNQKPEEVIVTAAQTMSTNGKRNGLDFGVDNYQYDVETGKLNIEVTNPADAGKVAWQKGVDEYLITYIYTNQEETYTDTEFTLEDAEVAIKLYGLNEEVTAGAQEVKNTADISDQTIDINVSMSPAEMSKGNIYANLEQAYTVATKVNVAYADITEEMTIEENADQFLNAEDQSIGNVNSIYQETIISKKNFEKILGENGTVTIQKLDGTGINIEEREENGNIIYTYLEEVEAIRIVTTLPVTEGSLTLTHKKAIKTDAYHKETEKAFQKLVSNVGSARNGSITLKEPATKADFTINLLGKSGLSTIEPNDVEFNIALRTQSADYDLYKNPTLSIELPSFLQNIEITPASVTGENFTAEARIEGNKIIVTLTGEQTEYSAIPDTISISARLTLNRLENNKKGAVTLTYTNENATSFADANGQIGKEIDILVQEGLIVLNTIKNYDDAGAEKIALDKDEVIELNKATSSKVAQRKYDVNQ